MVSGVKFVLNRAGVRELLKGKEMQDVLVSFATSVKERAGDGYDVYIGPNRANVSVGTATEEGEQDNYDNNTLEKAIRQ